MFREKVRNSGLHKGRKNVEERISEVKNKLLFFLVLMHLSNNILLKNTTKNIFNYVIIYNILIYACVCLYTGFAGCSAVKNLPAMWETWVPSLDQGDSLE